MIHLSSGPEEERVQDGLHDFAMSFEPFVLLKSFVSSLSIYYVRTFVCLQRMDADQELLEKVKPKLRQSTPAGI